MAAGAVHVSAKFVENMALLAGGNFGSNTIKMSIINNSITPAVGDTDPRWGAGGSQNYSTGEVTGGNYPAGGMTLAGAAVSISGAVTTLSCTSPLSYSGNASNPTNCYWGIVYDSTAAGKYVLGFVDLTGGGAALNTVGGFTFNVNSVGSGSQPFMTGTAT